MNETSSISRKTPLFEKHVKANAKLIPFGRWEMPVSYEGVIAEHLTVREKVGLFDVSHMGEIFVRGENALAFCQYLTINDVSKLNDGEGQYSAMCYESGGFVDDLIIYRLNGKEALLCVNASNVDKDYAWIKSQAANFITVSVENESDSWAQIAVQGPNSQAAMLACLPQNYAARLSTLNYMSVFSAPLFGRAAFVARTGYTGEHGYEIYLPNDVAGETWDLLLATSAKTGAKPIGLGARDTLRLEACYLLYGNDMDDTVSPLEAGIGWATRLASDDFIGKSALLMQKQNGVSRKTLGFKLLDKGIARHGMAVYFNGEEVGVVTSGSHLPSLDMAGGLARIKSSCAAIGDHVEIDIRGKRKLAQIIQKPLYSTRVK